MKTIIFCPNRNKLFKGSPNGVTQWTTKNSEAEVFKTEKLAEKEIKRFQKFSSHFTRLVTATPKFKILQD